MNIIKPIENYDKISSRFNRFNSTFSDISKACQIYGHIQVGLEGYQMYCKPLRDESKCKVEISVLRDGRLVEKRIYDGCKGVKLH